MNKNQTAVEWLYERLQTEPYLILHDFQQAKQIEKKLISDAWDDGNYSYFYSKETGRDFENGEEYYKTKFCNNDQ